MMLKPTMSAESIARFLGKTINDGNGWWRCPCPCCYSGPRQRPMLCLKDGDKGGLKIKCWKDCKRADIEQVLFARGLLSPADVTYYTPTPVNNDEDEDDRRLRKIEWLLKLTPQLCPISNTLAEHYLLHERHLPQLPPCDALGYWGAGIHFRSGRAGARQGWRPCRGTSRLP